VTPAEARALLASGQDLDQLAEQRRAESRSKGRPSWRRYQVEREAERLPSTMIRSMKSSTTVAML